MARVQRDWFQALFQVYFILYGIPALVNMNKYGGTVLAAIPVFFRYLFATCLVVSALGVLLAMFRPKSVVAVLRERAALLMVAGLGIVYSVWAMLILPPRGAAFILVWVTIAVASLLRVVDITRSRSWAMRSADGSERLADPDSDRGAGNHHGDHPLDQGQAGSQEDEH